MARRLEAHHWVMDGEPLDMRDVIRTQELRMQGIAAASSKLLEQGELAQSTGRRSLEQLLAAESVDRAVRVVNHQMWLAKFPVDRDLGGFDCDGSPVYRKPGMR
ncbi:ATP-binding protein [Paraburkholderia sp. CNPSo 3076]|uniref:ATP-binding protein n=1 Tax=Paraburkholderia sp. CNPSo 3076 TaxID=2940936 RepID=UPI00225C01EE|nr:ATP-binding protein [Paraburkholderia sp. CNPSo 3076]MCX5544911.1 ATP-binding protein [Paraburkholderia sp. CNPSo 3076]